MSEKISRFDAYLEKHRDNAQGDRPCDVEIIESAPAPALKLVESAAPEPAGKPEQFTLEDAFDYFHIPPDDICPSISPRNLERAMRAITFLLEWLSQHGNESVDGFAAHGLAQILNRCTDRLNLKGEPR